MVDLLSFLTKTNTKRRQTFFHIGGPKTGSSALQSWFSNNRDFLRAEGYVYPPGPEEELAKQFRIHSGNAHEWYRNPASMEVRSGFLWSAEQLFYDEQFMAHILGEAHQKDTPVVICGYYRNPWDWVVSDWMQGLKRGGLSPSLDEYVRGYTGHHLQRVLKWLEVSRMNPIEARLFNYDSHKNDLVAHFLENCLGLPEVPQERLSQSQRRVNRSLTPEEAIMLRQINTGQRGSNSLGTRISDILVNELPDIAIVSPLIERETFEIFKETVSPLLTQINSFVADEENIEIPSSAHLERGSHPKVLLPEKWFEVLGSAVSSIPYLLDSDADTLRELAKKIMDNEKLAEVEATRLLRLALRARPNGPQIMKLLEQAEKRANNSNKFE